MDRCFGSVDVDHAPRLDGKHHARGQYQRASALQPADVQYLLLAQALRLEGRLDEADAVFQRVAHTSPNLAAAQKTADSLLAGK